MQTLKIHCCNPDCPGHPVRAQRPRRLTRSKVREHLRRKAALESVLERVRELGKQTEKWFQTPGQT